MGGCICNHPAGCSGLSCNCFNDWSQIGNDVDREVADDLFGLSAPLSSNGSVLAVSAPKNNGINAVDSGCACAYEWSGSAWIQLGSDVDGEAAGDWPGYLASLSSGSGILPVGAPPQNDGVSGSDSSHAPALRAACRAVTLVVSKLSLKSVYEPFCKLSSLTPLLLLRLQALLHSNVKAAARGERKPSIASITALSLPRSTTRPR